MLKFSRFQSKKNNTNFLTMDMINRFSWVNEQMINIIIIYYTDYNILIYYNLWKWLSYLNTLQIYRSAYNANYPLSITCSKFFSWKILLELVCKITATRVHYASISKSQSQEEI